MVSKLFSLGSTPQYPAGNVGISLPLLILSLKNFTNQIISNNFIIKILAPIKPSNSNIVKIIHENEINYA